jgi:hypothetical protein
VADQLGVTARLLYGFSKQGAQSAAAGRDDEQRAPEICDFYRPTITQVPAPPDLGRQSHLTTVRNSKHRDGHTKTIPLTRQIYKAAL